MNRYQVSHRDRIQIDSSVHETYRELTEGRDTPFKTMKDVFMLAACLGYQQKSRTTLKSKQDIFHWSAFSEQEDIPILCSLGIAEAQDVDILVDQDRLLTIAEEYANTGISQIKQLVDQPGEALNNLASYFLQEEQFE